MGREDAQIRVARPPLLVSRACMSRKYSQAHLEEAPDAVIGVSGHRLAAPLHRVTEGLVVERRCLKEPRAGGSRALESMAPRRDSLNILI